MVQAPFRVVRLVDLDEVEMGHYRKAPGEIVKAAFALSANLAVKDVKASFMFELPDYPIAWAYQNWFAQNPNSIEDVGISIISRETFIKERGHEGLQIALSSMLQRGRPAHLVWLLYSTND
jgi:hypothetical protein